MISNDESERRNSYSLAPEVVNDPLKKAEIEAKNGLKQYDAALQMAHMAFDRGVENFKLRPSTILALHREALQNLSLYAGSYRPGSVYIEKSSHTPPAVHLVPELLEAMCDYVNTHWNSQTALHLAAYTMWRLNWIHPFADGNGRTSRIISYLVLTIHSGTVLPGSPTISEQIVSDRSAYFNAIEAADMAWKQSETVDVTVMEELLAKMLVRQLLSFYQSVGGVLPEPTERSDE